MPAFNPPRVAYFPDSFHEVNGVAHTSRHFQAFARNHNLPFLCVRAGDRSPAFQKDGNLWTLELPRGMLAFALEKDLSFDPAFPRHIPVIGDVLEEFQPTLIHITGPSELGLLGAALASELELPLAASWHTNVHEYLARRSHWLLRLLPDHHGLAAEKSLEDLTMAAAARFYSVAQLLFAPNPELCNQLRSLTGRPCSLMPRGVDTHLFHPRKRDRPTNQPFTLGFVGRLSVEKNVALLADIHDQLLTLGVSSFRFLIVGHGAEEPTLRQRMPNADFTGVLHGEALARAYANMDLFVFPSHTDTFGNVVLEALASGVPALVTPHGGPRHIVRDAAASSPARATGRVLDDREFAPAIAHLIAQPALLATLRENARAYALGNTWDAVFEGIYRAYAAILPHPSPPGCGYEISEMQA